MTFRKLAKFWTSITGRRRRQWRYISPRRRWVALLMLAAMLLLIYGYWYGTNDRKVCQMAENYIHDLTHGCKVKIRKAHFSPFSGISLEGVRICLPRSQTPVFEARSLLMRLRPWDLLSGNIKPVGIVCDQPVVTVYGTAGGGNSTSQFLSVNQENIVADAVQWSGDLPPILIREGTLKMVSKDHLYQKSDKVNISLQPTGEAGVYHIAFEKLTRDGAGQVPTGSLDYNVKTGATSGARGYIPEIADLGSSLPSEYSQWLRRYSVRGASSIRQVEGAGNGKLGVYEFEMLGLSLKLPEDQGGLSLANVRGKLRFGAWGVDMEAVSGNIVEAGLAKFEVANGRYDGYDAASPFDISLAVTDIVLPDADKVSGQLRTLLADMQKIYQPHGSFSVVTRLQRHPDGRLSVQGHADPQGMSALYAYFPYPMENIRGRVSFSDGVVRIENVTGSHGPTTIRLDGSVEQGWQKFDIKCKSTNVSFDRTLHDSLPKKFQEFWAIIGPGGSADGEFRITHNPGDTHDHVELLLAMLDGKASATYNAFPYRIENLVGEVKVDGDDVTIDSLQGRRGNMRCTISGKVFRAGGKDTDLDILVSARRVPLDDVLTAAMSESGRSLLRQANAVGEADRVVASITQKGGGALQYDVQVWPSGMSYSHTAFPYAVTDVSGLMTIRHNHVFFENLKGMHGRSPVVLDGYVTLGANQEVDLKVSARDVPLDKDLLASLPPEARNAWEQLSPRGKANLDLVYKQNLPGGKNGSDYVLTLQALGIDLRYAEFPYPFDALTGTAAITPGKIQLKNLKSVHGKSHVTVDGTISYDGKTESADLVVKAAGLPIDQTLLGCWPKDGSVPLVSTLKPGGLCDLDLSHLRFSRPAGGTPLTAPASKSASSVASWAVQGGITLSEAVLDVGFGSMTLTGSFNGLASSDQAGLAIDAQADLKRLEMSAQVVTDLTAHMDKLPKSDILHVADLAGKTLGGRLAGNAEVQLSTPIECWVTAQVNDLKLEDIFAAATKNNTSKGTKVDGTLAGSIRLRARVGDVVSQQAVGELWISRARLNQLPVLLGAKQLLLPLPGQSDYTDGVVRYELKGPKLTFNEINLSGSGMSIVGSGSLNMKSDALRLNFLGKPGGTLPRIDNLDAMLEPIVRELSEIRVTGSIQKPLVRNAPLKSIDDTSRRLSNPSREGD